MKPNFFLIKTVWAACALFVVSAIAYAEPIPIKIVAFGGKVTITNPKGASIKPARDAAIPVGATISTGPNSWIDLSQGGLSTIRVKAKTQSFTVTTSSMDEKSKGVTSLFKLKNGAAFVRVNKKALPKGSKYQVQMPELIAGVVGSEGEMVDGPGGCSVVCLSGLFLGGSTPIPPGSMLVDPAGQGGPSVGAAPDSVLGACNATMDTLPVPTGGAVDGAATGGTTDAGVVPAADAIGAVATGGSPTVDPVDPLATLDASTPITDTPAGETSSALASPSSP